MPGLNYGSSYRNKATKKEIGVSYFDKTNKYVVRVLNKSKQVSTIAQFNTKEEADKFYLDYTSKD